ncbi:hypothetical protein LguiA_004493 [Lonicera macranthoides]
MLCLTNANPFFLDFCVYRSFESDPSFFWRNWKAIFQEFTHFFVVFKSIEDNANFKLGAEHFQISNSQACFLSC